MVLGEELVEEYAILPVPLSGGEELLVGVCTILPFPLSGREESLW